MRKSVTLLLAEDNLSDAELILESLADHQHVGGIHIVKDGVEALEFLFAEGRYAGRIAPLPRVMLLDVKLPRLDGFVVLQRVKTDPRTRALPVVMLTSSNVERDIAAGYLLGANSFVQKPVEFGRFRDVVRQIAQYWLTTNEP